MATKLLKTKAKKIAPRKSPSEEVKKTVLVGTYKQGQLEAWPGFYVYPLTENDMVDVESAKRVNELWLFSGAKAGRFFAAEFLGQHTRDELKKQYAYPAKGKAHGDTHLLYKITKTDIYDPASGLAEAVIVRAKDFAKRSPKVAKQIKAYLESPDRNDPLAANLVPKILTEMPSSILSVWDSAIQLTLELPVPKVNYDLSNRLSMAKAMQILALSRHSYERLVARGVIVRHEDGDEKFHLRSEIVEVLEADEYKETKNGIADKRNTLNDLTGKDWIPETKSYLYQKGLGADSAEAQIEKMHPAPFSFQDIGHLIRFFTKRGMHVLDPFGGVGSTEILQVKNSGGSRAELEMKLLSRHKDSIKESFYPFVHALLNVIGFDCKGEVARFDALIKYNGIDIPVEIKSYAETPAYNIKGVRQAIENKILAYRSPEDLPYASLLIGYSEPKSTIEIQELIDAVYSELKINIVVLTLSDLVRMCLKVIWDRQVIEFDHLLKNRGILEA